MRRGAKRQSDSKWDGVERRSGPRVPRHNIGRAKVMVALLAVVATAAMWVDFALVQPLSASPAQGQPAPLLSPTPAGQIPSFPAIAPFNSGHLTL